MSCRAGDLPWVGFISSVPSSLAASSGNTTLATPACGRRPLTGVIPGHKQCGPIALYNAKDWKIQKAKSGKRAKGKSGKVQSRKSNANDFVVAKCLRATNRDSGTVALWTAPPHSPVVARKGTTSIGFPEFMCVPNEATISACLFVDRQ